MSQKMFMLLGISYPSSLFMHVFEGLVCGILRINLSHSECTCKINESTWQPVKIILNDRSVNVSFIIQACDFYKKTDILKCTSSNRI